MVKFILEHRGYICYRCHMVKVNESPTHMAYKKIGIDILKDKGFSPYEIHEEYTVEHKMNGRTKYIVDVVGIKDNHKIAIECGGTELSKVINLRKIFDEVILVNPAKVVEMYDYWKGEYLRLKDENRRLQEHADWVCKDANSRIDPLRAEIGKLETQIRSLKAKLRKLQRVIAQAWESTKEQS